jgi:hypothetical protein
LISLSLLLALGLAAALCLALIEMVIRRTDAGALLVLGLLVFLEAFPHISLSIMVGSVNVGPQDMLLVVIATAATARIIRAGSLTTPQRLLLLLGLLVCWAVVRGVSPFGLPAAVNEARRSLRFVFVALYFSTVEPRREVLTRLGWIWISAALALTGLTLARWGANSLGLVGGVFGDGGSLRVVPADSTLLIAQGAILAFPMYAERRGVALRYVAPALLVAVVILQHRTVWIAASIGLAYLLYRERALAKRLFSVLLVATAILGGLLFTVFAGSEEVVSEQLATSAQSTGTFEWRVEGWAALLGETVDAGLDHVAIGRPFGTGWTRRMSTGNSVEVSPHNYYIEALLRVGVLGLILFCLLYASALRGTSRLGRFRVAATGSLMTPNTLHVALLMQLVYYIAYAPDMAQAMLLGVGSAVAASWTAGSPESVRPRADTPA